MTDKGAGLLALWRAVFGEPPPMRAETELLLRLLVAHLPPAPPYGEPEQPVEAPVRDAG